MTRPGLRFTCNICRSAAVLPAGDADREKPTCGKCDSSVRVRAVALALSRTLFGADYAPANFPRLKSIRGLGISESSVYAPFLERAFTY
jgi:hypothetical protein